MNELYTTFYNSKIGVLKISGSEAGVHSVEFLDNDVTNDEPTPSCLEECITQLHEYFAGTRKSFAVKLNPQGTPFQKKVWQELLHIPYGRTASYLDIARAIGNEKAIRAVGAANGRNPIPILIPCHRVIGSNGALIGFGGGIWRKEFLLQHEGALVI